MNDITNPNNALVSTIADNMIPLVLCSGLLANIWIPEAATLPWAIPENKPAKAMVETYALLGFVISFMLVSMAM